MMEPDPTLDRTRPNVLRRLWRAVTVPRPIPLWLVLGCVLIAAWGPFHLALATQRDTAEQRRTQLAFCRDRNDTLRDNRDQELHRIRIDSEHFLAAGVDASVVEAWETDKQATIPSLVELVSDCDDDGVNADRGDFPRGAD